MNKGTTERRSVARFPRTFELEGRLEPEGDVARMVATNVSVGGLYCTSPIGFDEMTRLAVRLMLPLKSGGVAVEPVDLEAVVVRQRELSSPNGEARYELALFFPNLEAPHREQIKQYLSG